MLFTGFCDIDVFKLHIYLFFHVLIIFVLPNNVQHQVQVVSKIIIQ